MVGNYRVDPALFQGLEQVLRSIGFTIGWECLEVGVKSHHILIREAALEGGHVAGYLLAIFFCLHNYFKAFAGG